MDKSSLFIVAFIVLLTLKVTGSTDVSWWIVTSPLWGPLAVLVAIIAIVGAVLALITLTKTALDLWEDRKNGVR